MEVVENESAVKSRPVPARDTKNISTCLERLESLASRWERREGSIPGIRVFHLASVLLEKKSVVFSGTNDMSASHLTTLVVTVRCQRRHVRVCRSISAADILAQRPCNRPLFAVPIPSNLLLNRCEATI